MTSTRDTFLSRRNLLLSGGGFALAGCSAEEVAQPAAAAQADVGPAVDMPAPAPAAAAGLPIVTVLGDSITAGYGLSAAQALPVQLAAALKAIGRPAVVRGAGVSGDTTTGGLARVDFSVRDDTDLALVALGGNDLLQGVDPARIRSNLDRIIQRLQARDIPVMLAGMMAPPRLGTYARDFNALYPELAETRNVPLYPFLLDGVALLQRYNQPDGIHPNAEGARLIATRLAPAVAQALARAETARG